MKNCLAYWSNFWGGEGYWFIICIPILMLIRENGLMVAAVIYGINGMANGMFWTNTVGGHAALTLSLPMSRKTIYDTRMLGVIAAYLILLCAAVIGQRLTAFDALFTLLDVLFGHIICGLCVRKPHLYVFSGFPTFIALFMVLGCIISTGWEKMLMRIEKSHAVWGVLGVVCICMLLLDIWIWRRERRVFISGSHESGRIRRKAA